MKKEIDGIIVKSEIQGVQSIIRMAKRSVSSSCTLWECSSQRADYLRTLSWGGPVVGATVPHPFEMMRVVRPSTTCTHDQPTDPFSDVYLSVLVPRGMSNSDGPKGPYKAYLGSKTRESTSILRPWENETKIPLIRRASDLRKAFGWFIDPKSDLGQSILINLEALTGVSWDNDDIPQLRSGSALHRFSCSRQSQGGYIAQSPLFGTWMIETTDTMSDLGTQNYDFLFQAQLLYSQMTVGEIHKGNPSNALYHFHLDCASCLREISEVQLNSGYIYYHPNVSHILESWKPNEIEWVVKKTKLDLPKGQWDWKSTAEKSFHIGRMQGFLYGEMTYRSIHSQEDASLFPLTLREKLIPRNYMLGLISGLVNASSIAALYRKSIQDIRRPAALLLGQVLFLIDNISKNEGLINVWRNDAFLLEFISIPHRIPPSYPLNNLDLGSLGRNYLRSLLTKDNDQFVWAIGAFFFLSGGQPNIIIFV